MKIPRLTVRLRPNGRDMRIAVVAGVIPGLALMVGIQVGPAKIATDGPPFRSVDGGGPALRWPHATKNHSPAGPESQKFKPIMALYS